MQPAKNLDSEGLQQLEKMEKEDFENEEFHD